VFNGSLHRFVALLARHILDRGTNRFGHRLVGYEGKIELPAMAPELSPAPKPPRVMIVEDEVLVRFPIAEALRAVGLEVIEASNADEAWSYLLSRQTVDLIFSDIQMPGSMDGLELTRRVQERFGQIIVVLTSGRRSQRSTDHPHFLAKPYRLGNVTALIKSLLERKE
jgi:CheY-like chemotaxis protein